MADQTQSIELPSRGALYDGKLPDGKVTIRKLRVDELSLFETQGDVWERIESLLKACVSFAPGFETKNLLASDRFAILVALRNFTLPVKYPVSFRCKACGTFNQVKVDLATELTVKMAELEGPNAIVEPIDIPLPGCGRTVAFRFARSVDQEATAKYVKRLKGQNPDDPTDPTRKHLLARTLVSFDSKAPKNVLEAEQIISSLEALDILTISKVMDAKETGVDTELIHDCKECSFTNKVELPFTSEFFRPTDL